MLNSILWLNTHLYTTLKYVNKLTVLVFKVSCNNTATALVEGRQKSSGTCGISLNFRPSKPSQSSKDIQPNRLTYNLLVLNYFHRLNFRCCSSLWKLCCCEMLTMYKTQALMFHSVRSGLCWKQPDLCSFLWDAAWKTLWVRSTLNLY